jgi:hypothetical protein
VVKEHVQCGEACQAEYKPALSPFVANVLTVLTPKCKFTHNGCRVFIELKELEVHEVDCDYRNINCPFSNCKSKDVSFIGLGEHLEANHEDLKKIDEARSTDFAPWPLMYEDWIPQKLVFRNRSFFTQVHCDAAWQSRYFWIYFHGTPDEGESGKELIFKGKVYSLDETKKTVMANEDVFILSPGQAQQFKVDGKINFEITLYSNKEEIKNEDVESGISDNDDEQ